MSEQPDDGSQGDIDRTDPDRDPENLSPRDDRPSQRSDEEYVDPDADPENLNPREG
jgi:hypothetical protein